METSSLEIFPKENFIDLCLYQYGAERCESAHLFGPVRRNHFLFHYVIDGTGTLDAENRSGHSERYQIYAGQGFMIFPGQICTYYASRERPWHYCWIEFDGLKVRSTLERIGLSEDSPVYVPAFEHGGDRVLQEMRSMIDSPEGSSSFFKIAHAYLFLDALSSTAKKSEGKREGKLADYYMSETMVFIANNYDKDISVENMAANLGLNRSYFSTFFTRAIGKSPQRFLLEYRMEKAEELLLITDMDVQEVGEKVGYSNALHFSRAFRNAVGVSPSIWRKERRTQ